MVSENNLFSGSAGAQVKKYNNSKHFQVTALQGDVFAAKTMVGITKLCKSFLTKLIN